MTHFLRQLVTKHNIIFAIILIFVLPFIAFILLPIPLFTSLASLLLNFLFGSAFLMIAFCLPNHGAIFGGFNIQGCAWGLGIFIPAFCFYVLGNLLLAHGILTLWNKFRVHLR